MATDAVSTQSAVTNSTSSLSTSRKSIADNFDTFLSLLTTQLKNQSPLDPLDTNQFTQQLVQFTSVEQQLKTNEFLEAMMLASQNQTSDNAGLATQAINMIGKSVTAQSDTTSLRDGEASWVYTLNRDAVEAVVNITDSAGQVVFSDTGSLPSGQGTYTWDGLDNNGLTMPDGTYTLNIQARGEDGSLITVLTQVKGNVDRVDLTGDEPVLWVGDAKVSLSGVLSVSQAIAPEVAENEETGDNDDTEETSEAA